MAKAREIPGLDGAMPYRAAARAAVRVRAGELFDHAGGVLDTTDIERVHDMRVATRRLRAALEIFEPCFERELFKPVLRDVKRLADALGARRDPDVQLAALEDFAAAVPEADRPGIEVLAARLRAEQAQANERLAAALEAAEREDLRGRLAALCEERPEAEPETEPETEPAGDGTAAEQVAAAAAALPAVDGACATAEVGR